MNENKMRKYIKMITYILLILLVIVVIYLIINNVIQNSNKETQQSKEEPKKVVQAQEREIVLEDNKNVHIEQDASGDKVPVPRGYVGSSVPGENEIDTGYVIYEGETPVTSANVATAQTTRNQFVWVPVPDPSEMYGTDSNGKKWGKLYDFDKTTGAVTNNNWSENNEVMKISSASGYREPDIVKRDDIDSKLKTYNLGVKSMHEFRIQLEKELNVMIESVEKYGGFYIGRYETGNIKQSVPVVIKGNNEISSEYWYNMYERSKRISGGNEAVVTSMAWGCQWDATLKWFLRSSDEKVQRYIIDSTEMGNYTGSKKATGSSEAYKVNNIYDMAGNIYDRTIEVDSTSARVTRRRWL